MFRKLLIICVGSIFCAAFFMTARMTVNTRAEFLRVVLEINVLTDKSIEIMGDIPTLESVNKAKFFVEERKTSINEKLQNFRGEGRLRENSEEFLELNEAIDLNKIKIAQIFNNFVAKARKDMADLDDLRIQMWNKSKNRQSDKDIEILEQRSKQIEENLAVIESMKALMERYDKIS